MNMGKEMKSEDCIENLLSELEDIVKEMKDDTISLHSALEKYEEGINLYKRCRKILDEAQLKVELIKRDSEMEYNADA